MPSIGARGVTGQQTFPEIVPSDWLIIFTSKMNMYSRSIL